MTPELSLFAAAVVSSVAQNTSLLLGILFLAVVAYIVLVVTVGDRIRAKNHWKELLEEK
jgi:hypothetical protein